eukprot:TRINITY_DN74099_c0_g1_i1.p1 TRINITY_DN74099_c0_g1~~TRINITY_DN74099_c0_g1_i1.p1  ORF type:complete len:638 (-),score=142.68 TRINITY_DN74099_c0_g1_i1:285-1925(-)
MGGASRPESSFRALVSTPEAFRRLQLREAARFGWGCFAICVFDEVHHVLKDHPYRKLAHGLRAHNKDVSNGGIVQVLGLSASLTYAVGEASVKKALEALFRDLGLEKTISVSDEELRAGGYDPPHHEVEIAHPRLVPEGVVPEDLRKPHLMHQTFFGRVAKGEATDFAMYVMSVVKGLEAAADALPAVGFKSKLSQAKLSAWEDDASRLVKLWPQHGVLFATLEVWYVGLRMLVQTWEQEVELVLHWLAINDGFMSCGRNIAAVGEARVALAVLSEMANNESNFSKVACLKRQLLEKHAVFGADFRGLVFVEQRLTAHILAHYISNDSQLQRAGFRADYVAARDARITPGIKVSPAQAGDCISRFRSGDLNVVVATSVLEEGFDVPAANVVISFDHLKNSVELAQRFGRARQSDRRIVVMDQRRDRPIGRLEEVRREQDELIEQFSPASVVGNAEAEIAAQRSRERGASALLKEIQATTALQTLNLYVKKTKAQSAENCSKAADGTWQYTWQYDTVLRQLSALGSGASKADAKRDCAFRLLQMLGA